MGIRWYLRLSGSELGQCVEMLVVQPLMKKGAPMSNIHYYIKTGNVHFRINKLHV
jgi:hypothetical protein